MTLAVTDPDLAEHLHAALRKAQILYGVGIAAVFSIASIGVRNAVTDPWASPFEDDPTSRWILRVAFAAVSLLDLLAVAYLRRRVLAGAGDSPRTFLTVSGPPSVQRLFIGSVLVAAFIEAIAIYGLLLSLLGGQWLDVVAFGAAALIGFAIAFPRRQSWEEYVRSAAAARFDVTSR